ncbi:hypothetical protein MAR_014392 [Mya arenaria]|uniref:Transposase n=1 Tax=Mya arenaria TaxID=6604 RepID=A0ABY7G695_MYAAR|nr:hypothetical protein MAR_014378 [Mya arenaria]WAR28688.1 hypothetical protein MAR_014392 [Mya arenaria]
MGVTSSEMALESMTNHESKFNVDSNDRCQHVYRRSGERFTDACVIENDRRGGPSVMVLAGFTNHHKTQLVFLEYGRGRFNGFTAQLYVVQVLQPIVLPFLTAHPGTVLQHDNARPNVVRLTQNFLAAKMSKRCHGRRYRRI